MGEKSLIARLAHAGADLRMAHAGADLRGGVQGRNSSEGI